MDAKVLRINVTKSIPDLSNLLDSGQTVILENYIKELNSYEQIFVKFSNFSKNEMPLKNFILRKLAEEKVVPVDIDHSEGTLNDLLNSSENILNFSITDFFLNASFKNSSYAIHLKDFVTAPENLEKILAAIFQEISSFSSLDETNTLKTESAKSPKKTIKSLLNDTNSGKIHLVKYLGEPYIKLNSNIEFIDGRLLYDGRLIPVEFDILNGKESLKVSDSSQQMENLAITKDFIISSEAAQNLKTKASIKFSSSILMLWDNYIILSDGNIGDLTLSWWLKVSNTPLDYIILDNKLYILDISGNLFIVNLKTRRTIFNTSFEGAYMFKIDVSSNKTLHVYSPGKIYYIMNEKDIFVKDTENDSQYSRTIFTTSYYPSILSISVSPFGYFYENLYLGDIIYQVYIKDKSAYIITDVGTWKIKILE